MLLLTVYGYTVRIQCSFDTVVTYMFEMLPLVITHSIVTNKAEYVEDEQACS